MLIFLLIVGGLAVLFTRLPTSFLPEEDQGSVFVQVQLPVNASAERTRAVLDEVSAHLLQEEGDIVDTVMTIGGFKFAGRGQNSGMAFWRLKSWGGSEERRVGKGCVSRY